MKMIISTDSGIALYHTELIKDNDIKEFNPLLIAGMISAINVMNSHLFESQIEEFSFRTRSKCIVYIVFKESMRREEKFYFIFISSKIINKKKIKMLVSSIFIETKYILLNNPSTHTHILKEKLDKIIDNNPVLITELFN